MQESAQANNIQLDKISDADVAKFGGWLDGWIKSDVHNQDQVQQVKSHFAKIFSAQQALKPKSEELLTAHSTKLQAEGAVPLYERLDAAKISASMAEIHEALDPAKLTGVKFGANENKGEQRLALLQLIVSSHKDLKEGENISDKIRENIGKHAASFTADGLKTLQNELAQEMVHSNAALEINKKFGVLNIALAGLDACIEGKEHHLYALASADSIKGVDISGKSLEELEKLKTSSLDKLSKFWAEASTQELLKTHEVSITPEGGLDHSKLTPERKKVFEQKLAEKLINYINRDNGFSPEEKAMVKEMSKRAAAIQQDGPSWKRILENLFKADSISSFLTSGILGLVVGKIGSPMFGLVVTIMSFLLSSGAKKEAPAPAAK